MTPAIVREYRRMRAAGVGGIVGEDARICLDLARARAWYDSSDNVEILWETEQERYEDVYGMPAYQDEYYCCLIRVDGDIVASLGFIDQCSGLYARSVENELLAEAMRQS